MVAAHIQSASGNQETVENLRALLHSPQHTITPAQRAVLVTASTNKSNPWFKSVGRMEHVASRILALNFADVREDFRNRVNALIGWAQA